MRIANNLNMKRRKNYRFKKLLCAGVFCCSLALFCGCSVKEMSTLGEVSKPYAGLYVGESLMLGGTEMYENDEKLYLELNADNTFSLTYRGRAGKKGGYDGKYEYDEESHTITFYAYTGRRARAYTFPMKKGKIYIDYNLGGQLLHGVFALP